MSFDSQTAVANRQDFTVSFTVEADTNQTAKTLITPTAGKSIVVKGYSIVTEGTSGSIRLYFATSANTVGKTYAANAPATGYTPVLIQGARNEVLSYTSTFGPDLKYFIVVNYKEV